MTEPVRADDESGWQGCPGLPRVGSSFHFHHHISPAPPLQLSAEAAKTVMATATVRLSVVAVHDGACQSAACIRPHTRLPMPLSGPRLVLANA